MSKHFRSELGRFSLTPAGAARLLGEDEDVIRAWCRTDVPTPPGVLPRLGRLAEADFYRRFGDGPVAFSIGR